MKKTIIYTLVLIFLVGNLSALDECQGTVYNTDVPCIILLPINLTNTPCNTVDVTYYKNGSTLLFSETMSEYNPFTCNSTFNETNLGTVTFAYTTGDSGSITIIENVDNKYYLYVVVFLAFISLVVMGYYLEDNTFKVIAGMLAVLIAIDLFVNGFPNLTNTFLKNGMVTVIAGIGFYFLVAPTAEYLEGLK